jgi:hypothetical protein
MEIKMEEAIKVIQKNWVSEPIGLSQSIIYGRLLVVESTNLGDSTKCALTLFRGLKE